MVCGLIAKNYQTSSVIAGIHFTLLKLIAEHKHAFQKLCRVIHSNTGISGGLQ